jgi:hypothetical protein
MEGLIEEAERQALQCKLAGCMDGLVSEETCNMKMRDMKDDVCNKIKEMRRSIRPSIVIELVKIVTTIGVPLLYFYVSFKVLEAKFEFLANTLGVSLKNIGGR